MRKITVISVMIIGLLMVMCGCGKKADGFYETGTPDGYKRILAPESGASFLVPDQFLSEAREIAQFSDDCDYETMYLVQNDDHYVICSNEFIYCAVHAKGKIPSTLDEYVSIFTGAGLRLEIEKEKAVSVKTAGAEKIMADDVRCMALLSSQYFNDFTGSVAVVKSDTSCYGIYFGTLDGMKTNSVYEEYREKITKSLILDENTKADPSKTPISAQLFGVTTNAQFRNNQGDIEDVELQISEVLRGDEAQARIFKEMEGTLFESLPALEEGNEWVYVQVVTNKDTKKMLRFQVMVSNDQENVKDACMIDAEGVLLRFFIQCQKNVPLSLLIGEKCVGPVEIPLQVTHRQEDKVLQMSPDTSFSLEDIAEAVAGYEDNFNEDETEDRISENIG